MVGVPSPVMMCALHTRAIYMYCTCAYIHTYIHTCGKSSLQYYVVAVSVISIEEKASFIADQIMIL